MGVDLNTMKFTTYLTAVTAIFFIYFTYDSLGHSVSFDADGLMIVKATCPNDNRMECKLIFGQECQQYGYNIINSYPEEKDDDDSEMVIIAKCNENPSIFNDIVFFIKGLFK
jgi:hypothetical protein